MQKKFGIAMSLLIIFLFGTFTCEKNPTSSKDTGIVIDIDGHTYQTVEIGDQWWMAENLKVTHYRNGDPIPKVTDNTEWSTLTIGAYCNYDNDDNNANTYGSLYNWYAVNDSHNIAPMGWHVPTDEEWKKLELFLGMSQSEVNNMCYRGTDEGNKLKSISGWDNNGNGTDDFGFSALPVGFRGDDYSPLGVYTFLWSITEFDSNFVWSRALIHDYSGIYRYMYHKGCGFSVRCVRDN